MSIFNLFGDPFGDPFGRHPMQAMHQEMNMMLRDPFAGLFGPSSRAMTPFAFPDINSIMSNFNKMAGGGENCHSYSTSTVMTMSTGPDGRPLVYKESQSTRIGPGGVKETKRAVCDSRSGTKRVAIGHHLGERGHVKERIQNFHNGEQEETEELVGVDEDEAEEFDREWERRARAVDTRGPRISALEANHYSDDEEDYSRRRSRPLAITAPPSEEPSGSRKKSNKAAPYNKSQRNKR